MRSLSSVAILGAAFAAAASPAAAQVYQQGAPIPAAPGAQFPQPHVGGPGPVYVNQQGGPQIQGPQVQNGRVWQNGRWVSMPQNTQMHGPVNGNRWGNTIGGRWWGGSQAPGGWGAYRRPKRGWTLPGYWLQPDFGIPDYLSFGLSAPPYGYFWVRYYDDAVLVDQRGGVQSSVSGIGWTGAAAYAGDGYASSSAYAQSGAIGNVDPDTYYSGPQGGYAPSALYGQPTVQSGYYQGQAYQGCPNSCPPQVYTQQGGYNGGSSYSSGGGYYYGGGATTTTVVIQSPPVVTTTVIEEEVIEETTTTYVRAAPRRVVRRAPVRHKPRPAVRRQCGCGCCR